MTMRTLFGTFVFFVVVALAVSIYRPTRTLSSTFGDSQTFRVEVVSSEDHHIYFEKDRDGLRAERLIDERRTESTTYYFHYAKGMKGYEIFRYPTNAPENSEEVHMPLPKGIEYYWEVGQGIARRHEPQLFAENE